MRHMSVDIETYSGVDIKSAGAFRYIEDDSFEILLISYSVDGSAPVCIDLACGDTLSDEFTSLLFCSDCIKHAYNAAFEWAALSKFVGRELPLSEWRCTMVHGLYCGFAAGLLSTGAALGLDEERLKSQTGKSLIKFFCTPQYTQYGIKYRNRPQDNRLKWRTFIEYNRQDVIAEMAIEEKLSHFPVPDFVWHEWETDMRINARGVALDMGFVGRASRMAESEKVTLMAEAENLSGNVNPKSTKQLMDWLEEASGEKPDNLRRETVAELLESSSDEVVCRMLEIRQSLSMASIKKYDAMQACKCRDGRARGLLQFYGASRTGRWAGRLVQNQNLPRTHLSLDMIDLARGLVQREDAETVRLIFGDVNDTLSQLIRSAFVAEEGKVFIDADFSAIEARIISWIADEKWRLEAFRSGKDIYCVSASQMFGVPVEKHGINGHLRQKGKVAELALGFQGSSPALIRMGALTMGIPEKELPDIVDKWRAANPKIKALWESVEQAAVATVDSGRSHTVNGLVFAKEYDTQSGLSFLTIRLPSGRKLYYNEPVIFPGKFGKRAVSCLEYGTAKKGKRTPTYGGKLTENIVQATARDCLAFAMRNLEAAGYNIVFHIHDEVVIEAQTDNPDKMLDDVAGIMKQPAPWAEGLPLDADGWTGHYFRKD